jgi:alginate O-acetyltransferase complex protein AlgI
MVFSSTEFLWYFLPVVLALYFVLPPAARNPLLALSSILFYTWGARSFVLIFLFSILLNYVVGRLIGRYRERGNPIAATRVMVGAIMVNLAILFGYKYLMFAIEQVNALAGVFGSGGMNVPEILLPIGISFFTFHGISYVVDVNREESPPMRSIADYTQYMAFFPQLIAGPIIRYHEIDAQIRAQVPRRQRLGDLADGFPRFALGLSKKVLIADQVAPIADAAFASGDPSFTTAWIGALAYTVQIYFDFSGYSDMAIGIARMFGFRFPENFNRPYSALSLTDFWRRWHMSLSRWFRDYVYIPLGGSRHGEARTIRNLCIVFFLTGFWHGAAWTFIAWGAFHGGLLIVEKVTGIARWSDERWVVGRRAATFVLVVFGWVLFRAVDIGQAMSFMGSMLTPTSLAIEPVMREAITRENALALAIGLSSVLLPRSFVMGQVIDVASTMRLAPVARIAVVLLVPYTAVVVAAGTFSPFLYFQF